MPKLHGKVITFFLGLLFKYLVTGGSNKNVTDNNLAKIEASEELKGKKILLIIFITNFYFLIFNSVPTVSKDVAKAIQAGRQKLGITQKDLAQVIYILYFLICIYVLIFLF